MDTGPFIDNNDLFPQTSNERKIHQLEEQLAETSAKVYISTLKHYN